MVCLILNKCIYALCYLFTAFSFISFPCIALDWKKAEAWFSLQSGSDIPLSFFILHCSLPCLKYSNRGATPNRVKKISQCFGLCLNFSFYSIQSCERQMYRISGADGFLQKTEDCVKIGNYYVTHIYIIFFLGLWILFDFNLEVLTLIKL